MNYKGFKILSIITSIFALATFGASLYFLIVFLSDKEKFINDLINAGIIIKVSSPEQFINSLLWGSTISAVLLFFLNIFSFILVVVSDRKGKLKRWYFIPGLICGFFFIGYIVGLIYFIVTLITMIKADIYYPPEKEVSKSIIKVSIVYFVIGILCSIVSNVVYFDPSVLSLMCWVGYTLMAVSVSAFTFVAFNPTKRIEKFWKFAAPIVSIFLIATIYFIFYFTLQNNAPRFNGDWKTMHIALLSSIIMSVIVVIAYIIFGVKRLSLVAFIRMLDLAPILSFVAVILANFLSLYIVIIIEVVIGTTLTLLLARFVGPILDAYTSDLGNKYILDNGTEITYVGGDNYTDDNGGKWKTNDGGSTFYKTDD